MNCSFCKTEMKLRSYNDNISNCDNCKIWFSNINNYYCWYVNSKGVTTYTYDDYGNHYCRIVVYTFIKQIKIYYCKSHVLKITTKVLTFNVENPTLEVANNLAKKILKMNYCV